MLESLIVGFAENSEPLEERFKNVGEEALEKRKLELEEKKEK